MRTLTVNEVDDVSGGIGVGGAVIGGAIGAGSAALNGAGAGQVVSAAIMGAVSGFFDGIATAGMGRMVSGMFGTYSVSTGILSGVIGTKYQTK